MKRKKTEFSKTLFLVLFIEQSVIILAVLFNMIRMGTTEGIEYIFAPVAAQVATAVGFYYWKAKAENMLKIKKEMKEEGIDDNSEINISDSIEPGFGEDNNF